MKILLVEDDPLIASGLKTALSRAHHSVEWLSDGLAAQEFLRREEVDLLILDLGLPGRDGFDVLSRLRDGGAPVSVLILSARDATQDRVRGLDLGADDYLVKPFELEELLARIRALERRRAASPSNTLVHGDLSLDLSAMTVSWKGAPVELARREWMLLRLLMENPQRVFNRDQIGDTLYGWGEGADSNAVDVHVHHLRRKLSPQLIQTVRGVGYRIGPV
jgi:two-component system response regulator QseB